MESIEVITGTTKEIEYENDDGEKLTVDVPIWNATIANLTLLALGSSAPEILLSVIESLKDLGKPAGVLGPASIVGSGAFNLFVITGISIVSVGNEENEHEFKKIYDLGVYATTACFSIFAYSWMYFCLEIYTPDEVDLNEAWLTLFFFVLLVGLSFAADKYKQNVDKRSMNETTKKEKAEKEKNTAKQCALRKKAKKYGDQAIIACARGTLDNKDISSNDQGEIKALFKALLKTEDLTKFTPEELLKVLEPEALLEKFAYKKANKIGKNADTFEMKGMKGQIEEDAPGSNSKNNHDMVGFKCLHYSVLESSGNVELTVK
jgi:Ca2+/Na+ antiporter